MDIKKIKNGFKVTTVFLTIISLIGCSSKTQKEIPVYKQEIDDPLQIGDNYKKFEDNSSLKINVAKNKYITSILKTSKKFDNKDVCLKYLELENNALLEKLGPFYSNSKEIKNYISNNNYSISIKKCEIVANTHSKNFEYEYTIEVRPLSKSAQDNMNGVLELFKGIGLWLFTVVVIAPIMLVGMIVIGIPLVTYWMITGKKSF